MDIDGPIVYFDKGERNGCKVELPFSMPRKDAPLLAERLLQEILVPEGARADELIACPEIARRNEGHGIRAGLFVTQMVYEGLVEASLTTGEELAEEIGTYFNNLP